MSANSLVTGCPVKKIRQYVKLICQGLLLPPKDGRLCPLKKSEPKQEDVHAFFVYLYEHLAEPLAILLMIILKVQMRECLCLLTALSLARTAVEKLSKKITVDPDKLAVGSASVELASRPGFPNQGSDREALAAQDAGR